MITKIKSADLHILDAYFEDSVAAVAVAADAVNVSAVNGYNLGFFHADGVFDVAVAIDTKQIIIGRGNSAALFIIAVLLVVGRTPEPVVVYCKDI